MVLSKVPVVLLVFAASWLAAPLIYTLDKLVAMEDQRWVFAAGVVTLPLFGLICTVLGRDSTAKQDIFFYVFSIFSFTCVVDLFIALELDGYASGFMEFYLREGEPYLRTSYGTLINWWDSTGHFAMYTIMIALMCARMNYRLVGLYWVGSICNSMVVFMAGNVTGNKGLRWSYLLNVPYVFYPIYAGVRFIRDGLKVRHFQGRKEGAWDRLIKLMFGVWFVAAIAVAMFRMVTCMGCKDEITTFYLKNVEPFLDDPTQYGRMQALVFFYYYIPFYCAAIGWLLYPGQHWVKDWSLIFAGASIQAQLVFIWCSLKWRTDDAHKVPDTFLARAIFWPLNLSLVIVPHLFASYLHVAEIQDFASKFIVPMFKSIQGEVKSSQSDNNVTDLGAPRQLRSRNRPDTRQKNKIH